MRRLTLLLLLLISTTVLAEWTEFGGNTDFDLTSYIDFETIKRKDNKVWMWSLFDYKTVQKFKNYRYLSQVSRMEYDCEEETKRILDFYWYSENMRSGEVVYSETSIESEEESIIPVSLAKDIFEIVCNKK
jgi:hypothetical protein